ncbi:MAG TPA: biotin carboxylase N-terminal domain-containing protein, partial [Acetobacteraceae bacterium]|nr:biotin carboxylase N-terminal domain-containing protein [Acetobacteraceae bacterium]
NRGEIACRVMRTARRMGMRCIAVYSEADRNALHVREADEAYLIGAAPARESYLSIAGVLDAARRSGAQAIHPGYGFLSENAEFAAACAEAAVTFVGPPAAAIRAMGSKAAAKALMAEAGVPLVPGYHGAAQDFAIFAAEAEKIGYPVLIKASAGGGGKGMRVVEHPDALRDGVESAQREALASFGDDRILIEKYLGRPRHIEIQVFADTHGNCVSLFERDCSVQRRHQKVLEEAPAPGMEPSRRAAMGEAAVAAARAVGYVGAGTVEFIAEGDNFYFMEMNTRLQVEHPVTELITGLDLVEWQLRVAAGEKLPAAAGALHIDGHAIEARIYAEDPSRDFLPSIGTLRHLRLPADGEGIRVDAGVSEDDAITPYYDPMIAKLIVHGPDRAAAVARLRAALDRCEVTGVRTNLDLLRAVAAEPDYADAVVDTGFIARHPNVLEPPAAADAQVVLAAAALDALSSHHGTIHAADPHSPWAIADAWRLNGEGYQDFSLLLNGTRHAARAHARSDGTWRLTISGQDVLASLENGLLRLDGVLHRLRVLPAPEGRTVVLRGRNYEVGVIDPLAPPRTERRAEGKLTAPIPARVTRVGVAVGDAAPKGSILLTLEAMKMELSVTAPFDGVVKHLPVAVGDMVAEGSVLVEFAPAETA